MEDSLNSVSWMPQELSCMSNEIDTYLENLDFLSVCILYNADGFFYNPKPCTNLDVWPWTAVQTS